MPFDQTILETMQRLTASLQEDLEKRVRETAAELAAAAEEERMAAEAESASTLAAEVAAARAEADQRIAEGAAQARAEAEQSAAGVRAELDTSRRELDELKRARAAEQGVAAELAEARERLARTEEELERLRQIESSSRIAERQDKLAGLDRLLASFRRLDAAATLSDVLAALTDGVAAESPRSAILVASGDAFQPFIVTAIPGAARPLTPAEAANLSRGLPFAPLPPDRVGFSVPIVVGGKTVALVYADDASGQSQTVPASWPEAVEALARHAAQRLECLTALRTVQALSGSKSGASPVSTAGRVPAGAAAVATASTTEDDQSARRYARLLVSEIKLYNEGTVRLGRQNRDLLDRLRPEIERARKLYEERVPAHVPARSTYFDDELVQTLADGDPALLGARR